MVSPANSESTANAAAGAPAELVVELVYALPAEQCLLALTVAATSTVEQVIHQSGLLSRYPDIDLAHNPVGIWSRLVPLSQPVQAGDRIEIYRPLVIDPATTLRQREKAKRRR